MGLTDVSPLAAKQRKFVADVGSLIVYAYSQGYELSFGDAYRDGRCWYGHTHSLHKLRLAVDLNLFKNGVYLTDTADHKVLGEFWESLGNQWGGRFGDGNHYSVKHNHMR